jgi:hypothetical protein
VAAVTVALAWTALVLAVAVVGRLSWCCLRAGYSGTWAPDAPCTRWITLVEESFCGLVSGFAVLSACFFLLAHFGLLSVRGVWAAVALVVASCVVWCYRRGVLREAWAGLPQDLAFGLALLLLSVVYSALLPPFDTTIVGSDSSIYLGAAHQLARQGTIRHHDSLVAEMTAEEREALLKNRFAGDHTGPYARLPGGVPLVSPAGDVVTFYFYHLLPVWLAVGLETVGSGSYLRLMGLFGCLGLLSVFLIGRRLGGNALGSSVCVVHASFYPQVFFSRLPLSELPAQALFLCGLFALLRGLGRDEVAGRPHQRLAGLAWGALCLCRVDALPLLWLGLAGLSLLPARTGVRARDWSIPMLITIPFGAMAVYHQLSNGIHYVGPVGHDRLAAAVSAAVAGRQWLSLVFLAVMAGAAFLVRRFDAAGSRPDRLHAVLRVLGLVAAAATVALFFRLLDWGLVARHVRWVALYTTPFLLLLLCGGVMVAVAMSLRPGADPGVKVILVFFTGSAACYLANPMVIAVQPWAIRRFVPMVFPLLLALSLYGWQAALRRPGGPRAAPGAAVFAGLVIATAGTFLRSSAGLAMPAVRADAAARVDALARAIPPDALVVMPDANADLHVQTALEFRCARDVLLLPLAGEAGPGREEMMARYVARQIDRGRRVFLLLARPTDLPGPLLRHFRPTFLFEAPLSFEMLPFVPGDVLPGFPQVGQLQSRVVELHSLRDTPVPRSIRIGDLREDIGTLVEGFHGAEIEARAGQPPTPFRWTGPLAKMAFPSVASIVLTIDTWRPSPAPPASIEARVDGVLVCAVRDDTRGRRVLRIPFPREEGPPAMRIVSLQTSSFSMKQLNLSEDARELGVRVFSADIEP